MATIATLSPCDVENLCQRYFNEHGAEEGLKDELDDRLENEVADRVKYQVKDQLKYCIKDQVNDEIGDQIKYELETQLENHLDDQDKLKDRLINQLKVQFKDRQEDQLKYQLEGNVSGFLEDQPRNKNLNNCLYDQFEEQLNDQLKNRVENRNKLRTFTFKVLHYEEKPVSDAPAGFLGRHKFLCVTVQRRGRSEQLHFFTKSAPTDIASRLEYLEEFGVFRKEIIVYRKVLPNLEKIFSSVAPKCYHANSNLLVFENLAELGFRMAASRDGLLNYQHLNCVLRTLAAMHTASIVYELRQGKKLPELFSEAVVENAYPSGVSDAHVRLQNFHNANRALCEMIKLLPKYSHNLAVVVKAFPRRMQAIFQLCRTSTRHQNVFSHGDLWANNILFSYDKIGEMPLECRLVDFQLARYAPAILDVITVLTIPTSRAFRERFLSDLLCDYYGFMGEFLRREGLGVEQFMPREEFFASVEEFRVAGLIESCLFSHLTILPPSSTTELTASTDGFNDFFDRKRTDICLEAFRTDEIYRDRMTDMIEDFVDNFVLK